jgi:hypothetical protein
MLLSLSLLISLSTMVSGKGFLDADEHSVLGAQTLGQDLITAMDEVLGCGGLSTDPQHLADIEAAIRPMWRTMPSTNGKVDWKSLRYVAHRYFMQQSSLLIRGLEPSRALNDSDVGAAEILSQQLPAHTDVLFGGTHSAKAYGIEDAVALLAALERLVFDAETHLLERVYKQHGLDNDKILGFKQQKRVLEAYMVHWMMGEDTRGINILLRNRTLLDTHFPRWHDVRTFVEGRLKTLEYSRSINVKPEFGRSLMDRRFTFSDTHEVVGGVTKHFQSYWQSECEAMKNQLVEMDKEGTGRVRLSDFYGTGLEKDWRFGESEEYLRQLGVLDESSPWRGKQVIIPNYLQAASNCIVSAPHYLVCCMNECESLMGDIESAISEPSASAAQLLQIVGNLTSPSSPNDEPPMLQGALSEQLHRIADAHGGRVPLHGRLFAQWLHYAFPRECPFPHKVGAFNAHTLTPHSFGKEYIASKSEMISHVESAEAAADSTEHDEAWMSQWSEEEELFADYTGQLQAPWETRGFGLKFLALFAIVAVALLWLSGVVEAGKSREAFLDLGMSHRSHMV